jgi:hypothetical protein
LTIQSRYSLVQVDLLLNYICSDPRSTVHIVALKCLTKLAKRYRGRISFQAETVEIMLSILENPQRSFHLKALALQALRQVPSRISKLLLLPFPFLEFLVEVVNPSLVMRSIILYFFSFYHLASSLLIPII